MIARRRPQVPGDHAGGMPNGVHVGVAIPQIDMPAEPVDLLSADAAEAGPAREAALRIGGGGHPETRRQPIRFQVIRFPPMASYASRPLVGEPPGPSGRPAAL